jgi:hypothetical protein
LPRAVPALDLLAAIFKARAWYRDFPKDQQQFFVRLLVAKDSMCACHLSVFSAFISGIV